eukprot:1137755-Pelagomonas_calceolata.AAC.1
MVLGMSKGLGTLPWLHSAINQAASLYGVVLVLVCVKGWATRSPLLPCNRATVYNNAHSADNRNSPMRAGEDGEHMGRKQQPGFINTGQVVLDGLPYLEAAGLNLDSVRRVSKGFKSIERDANMHASVPKASIVACKCIGKMLVPESLSLWCSSSKAARWLCFTIKQITGSRPSASSHPACIACTGTDDLESTRTVLGGDISIGQEPVHPGNSDMPPLCEALFKVELQIQEVFGPKHLVSGGSVTPCTVQTVTKYFLILPLHSLDHQDLKLALTTRSVLCEEVS